MFKYFPISVAIKLEVGTCWCRRKISRAPLRFQFLMFVKRWNSNFKYSSRVLFPLDG